MTLDDGTRQLDILAFYGANPTGPSRLRQTLAEPTATGSSGMAVTGIQKVAQRAYVELFTPKGSLQYLPDRGTNFINDLQAGRIRSAVDVAQSFESARVDMARNLPAEETGLEPADEQYGDMRLVSVTLDSGVVNMRIILMSAAGTTFEFIEPLPQVNTGSTPQSFISEE